MNDVIEVSLFKVIFLMGLMVFGKIVLVIVLCKVLLVELISVDFVFIYWGMDIGIVKLDVVEFSVVLYWLLDILDFVEVYFVVDFCCDVLVVMVDIVVVG